MMGKERSFPLLLLEDGLDELEEGEVVGIEAELVDEAGGEEGGEDSAGVVLGDARDDVSEGDQLLELLGDGLAHDGKAEGDVVEKGGGRASVVELIDLLRDLGRDEDEDADEAEDERITDESEEEKQTLSVRTQRRVPVRSCSRQMHSNSRLAFSMMAAWTCLTYSL